MEGRQFWEEFASLFVAAMKESTIPYQPTVRVRIAVAVTENSEWSAYGGNNFDDVGSDAEVRSAFLGEKVTVHVVEASVPVPVKQAEQTIEGQVRP